MSWPLVRAGEICTIVSGSTPRTTNPENWNGDIVWLTPKDLSQNNNKYISDSSQKITKLGFDSCSTRMLPPLSVLMSSRAPIGHLAINTIPVCTNQGFKSFVPDPLKLKSEYLYWWLDAQVAYIQSLGNGATFKEVSKSTVEKLKIPLPPLDEQKRIAAILDKADELRRKRKEAIEKLDSLIQSIFLEMFGDPVTNPKGWDRKTLRQLIKVKSGNGLVSKDMAEGGTRPVYGGNGINGYHNDYMFEDPVIVLGRVGVYCGSVQLTKPKAWVTDNAMVVQKLSSELYDGYLVRALRLANLNQYAGRAAQPLISGNRIYPVEINVPTKDLQQKFVAVEKSYQSTLKDLKYQQGKLDNLFHSLQQRAFKGEL